MSKSDEVESNQESLETYENKKVVAFKGLVLSFMAWQLGQMALNNFAELLPVWLTAIFHGLNFFGAITFVGFIFYSFKVSHFLKGNSKLYSQVNDERAKLVRLRAMSYGLVITLGASALVFAASTLFDSFSYDIALSGSFVAQLLILVAVSSTCISYLIVDRSE